MNIQGIDPKQYNLTLKMLEAADQSTDDINLFDEEAAAFVAAHRKVVEAWIDVKVSGSPVDIYSADPDRMVQIAQTFDKIAAGERIKISADDATFFLHDHNYLIDVLSVAKFGMTVAQLHEISKDMKKLGGDGSGE